MRAVQIRGAQNVMQIYERMAPQMRGAMIGSRAAKERTRDASCAAAQSFIRYIRCLILRLDFPSKPRALPPMTCLSYACFVARFRQFDGGSSIDAVFVEAQRLAPRRGPDLLL